MWPTFTVTVTPQVSTTSWLQSNWQASPGSKRRARGARPARRHEGRRRPGAALPRPRPRMAPDRVMLAVEAEPPASGHSSDRWRNAPPPRRSASHVTRSRLPRAAFAASSRSSSSRRGPSFGSGCTVRSYSKAVSSERSTFRPFGAALEPVARPRLTPRQLQRAADLLDRLPLNEVRPTDPGVRQWARTVAHRARTGGASMGNRPLAHSPQPASQSRLPISSEALWTPSPEGSLLDAHNPGNRVPIPRLSTAWAP